MGAATSHLRKLDRVQGTAQHIGGFQVESLDARREAAAMSFGLRLLSGSCKGVMNKFIPELYTPSNCSVRSSRHTLKGIQIKPVTDSNSLNVYKFGFHGALPRIWAKLPQQHVSRGV